jgi:hypothetical protein
LPPCSRIPEQKRWRSSDRKILARRALLVIVLTTLLAGDFPGAAALERSDDRPYLMPASERARIQRLTTTENWARDELEKVRRLAKTDGYSAALLYALDGDESNLATAKRWLMQYRMSGGDLGERALKADEDFFGKASPGWETSTTKSTTNP